MGRVGHTNLFLYELFPTPHKTRESLVVTFQAGGKQFFFGEPFVGMVPDDKKLCANLELPVYPVCNERKTEGRNTQ